MKIINKKEKNSFLDNLSTGNRSGRVVLVVLVWYATNIHVIDLKIVKTLNL